MKRLLIITALFLGLQASAQTGLKIGTQAPLFTVNDNTGKTLNLAKLLTQHKSIVLFFYRGQWCPYCNKHIQQLQDSLQLLTGKGAYVIGVTPETSENIGTTVSKTHATFS